MTEDLQTPPELPPRHDRANRWARLFAALIDAVIMSALFFPLFFLTGYFERVMDESLTISDELLMTLAGVVIQLVLHGYLLVKRGQTIGKWFLNIQIVDAVEGKLLPFLKVFVFRYLWYLPLSILFILIPGQMDDQLLSPIFLADALFIFGNASRCLHDYIAGSKVVIYREGRERLGQTSSS